MNTITEIIPDDMPAWAREAIADGRLFREAVKRGESISDLIEFADGVSDALWGGERGWERVGLKHTLKVLRERLRQ